MRFLLPFAAVVLLAGCDVENDPKNEKVTVQYDRERIEHSAKVAGRTAKDVASGVGRVAKKTGRAVADEVGDVDVKVKVTRDRRDGDPAEPQPTQ